MHEYPNSDHFEFKYINIYFACLSVWPNSFVTSHDPRLPHMTPRKVYEWLKFQKLASNKIRLSLSFENPRIFFYKNLTQRENVHNWNRRWACTAQCPESLVSIYLLNFPTQENFYDRILRLISFEIFLRFTWLVFTPAPVK